MIARLSHLSSLPSLLKKLQVFSFLAIDKEVVAPTIEIFKSVLRANTSEYPVADYANSVA